MEYLFSMHARLVITITLYFAILAGWGLIATLRRHGVSRSYAGALAIGQLLVTAEVAIGVLLLLGGLQPSRMALHIIYGIVAVLALPAAYLYTQERDERLAPLVYALVCLFLCGIALRAVETGRA